MEYDNGYHAGENSRLLEKFYHHFDKYKDTRVNGWPLMDDFMETVVIVVLYLLVCGFGPRIMAKREPFHLRPVIICYNLVMVIVSVYMVVESVLLMTAMDFNFLCQEIDYSDSPISRRSLNLAYLYFISKVVELFDTLFFILRKKESHISFLHLYHHATMPLIIWFGPRSLPGGQGFVLCLCNSTVHVIMYFYYGLAAIGPHMQKYLGWKRYLTSLQLIQFLIIIGHASLNLGDCGYPRIITNYFVYLTIPHVIFFSNFYYQTYIKGKQRQTVQITMDKNGKLLANHYVSHPANHYVSHPANHYVSHPSNHYVSHPGKTCATDKNGNVGQSLRISPGQNLRHR